MEEKKRFYRIDPEQIREKRPIFIINGKDKGCSYLVEMKATKLINTGQCDKYKDGLIVKW